MKHILLSLLLLSPVCLPQGQPTELAQQIHGICRESFPDDEPGAAVIAVLGGKTVFRRGYGLASVELGVAVRPDMAFCLASVTKPFTATAVMMLVQDGELALADSAAKHLPKVDLDPRITVEHLLAHSSGLRDLTAIPGYGMDSIGTQISSLKLCAAANGQRPQFAPGARFRYTNLNYALLAKIVANVSGKSWERFLRERIFEPCGMKRSCFGGHDRVIPGAVLGYTKRGSRWLRSRALSFTRGYGLGGLFSSVDDLAAFDAALRSGKLLNGETRKRMFTPYALASGRTSRYALGWGVKTSGEHTIIAHSGGIFGWRTNFTRVPSKGICVAVLTNRAGAGNPAEVAQRICALLLARK